MKKTVQTTTTTCDRCGEFADGLKPLSWGVVTVEWPGLTALRPYDICPGCLVLVRRSLAPLDPA